MCNHQMHYELVEKGDLIHAELSRIKQTQDEASAFRNNPRREIRFSIQLNPPSLEPYLRVYMSKDKKFLELFHSDKGFIFQGERVEYQGEFAMKVGELSQFHLA